MVHRHGLCQAFYDKAVNIAAFTTNRLLTGFVLKPAEPLCLSRQKAPGFSTLNHYVSTIALLVCRAKKVPLALPSELLLSSKPHLKTLHCSVEFPPLTAAKDAENHESKCIACSNR
jgi:hypothetical protein